MKVASENKIKGVDVIYFIGWILSWAALSFGIHKVQPSSEKKSKVMTIGGGFVGAMMLLAAGAFIHEKVTSNDSTNSATISPPQNASSVTSTPSSPCEPIKDPKACHTYSMNKLQEISKKIDVANTKGEDSSGLQTEAGGWLNVLERNCDAAYAESCLTRWTVSDFKKTEFLEKAKIICAKNRNEESCGPIYDMLKKLSCQETKSNDQFCTAIDAMNELGIKPYLARIRFSKPETTATTTVDELMANKDLYRKKIIGLEGYGFAFDFKEGRGSLNAQEEGHKDSSKSIPIHGLAYFSAEKENKFKEFCPAFEGKENERRCGKIKIWGELIGTGEAIGFDVWNIEKSIQ